MNLEIPSCVEVGQSQHIYVVNKSVKICNVTFSTKYAILPQ